jgi:hypothetical protein
MEPAIVSQELDERDFRVLEPYGRFRNPFMLGVGWHKRKTGSAVTPNKAAEPGE